ncbi:putative RNase H-like HicB family nuclease [Cupriavidus gilardii J11]|uniref:Putative RNase H-like HicB family nuclease n=1 Tax=Cupriavidus gilardii J11 TaxID=936133 RepID=A0A562B3P0_9BURK|nr:type II toxin-antitoxin system HicB family antitoxin [Cupriavidus gilardii]TWG79628.1 putative RNase H-like HicB family nuclease [Cupriavidus gilardii J11]
MEFPIAIHKDDGSVYGVTVPDIPGCHSWGDTIEDAIHNAKDAITGHMETLAELGEVPDIQCSAIEELAKRKEYQGAIWALVDVEVEKLDTTPERVNISLPRFMLRKIDAYVESRHETRSGFLARAAMDAMSHSA